MELKLKLLNEKDAKEIMTLYRKCSDFFDMTLGEQPKDCHALLTDLPPKCSKNDKRVYGYYDESNTLRALVDIVDNYPNRETSIIGLILIDPILHRRGIGTAILNFLEEEVRFKGKKKMRLVIIEENIPSQKFWGKHGYQLLEVTKPRKHGKKTHKLLIYEKSLVT